MDRGPEWCYMLSNRGSMSTVSLYVGVSWRGFHSPHGHMTSTSCTSSQPASRGPGGKVTTGDT